MVESLKESVSKLPWHLKKYVVDQNYARYTPEDQSVWRFVMRQLKFFLSNNAHSCYLDGLEKTGLRVDKIPAVAEVHEKIQQFGWRAVPVSGFIPPAAFMEFQALGFLPIASDMRTIEHILYTPAPDIVHEAAGHAPILVDKKFADYLQSYAEVASKAIISSEDIDLYLAIRNLSDLKETSSSTEEDIAVCEKKLHDVIKNISFISEASLLGRMNWWTAEYGLIGDLSDPKIFGAGLLSSIGESRSCLKDDVKKIPLTVDCIEHSYDITEKQPQLFVTPDFEQLQVVLEDLAKRMAYRRGGSFGLDCAIEAKTTNTVELDSGLQISGTVNNYRLDERTNEVKFFKLEGGVQLCAQGQQLQNHGTGYHKHGYSSPIGKIKGHSKTLFEMTEAECEAVGIIPGKEVTLEYESGIVVKGTMKSWLRHGSGASEKILLLTFDKCTVTDGNDTLYEPEWGLFDLATGTSVPSVFGGPADRPNFEEENEFKPESVPKKDFTDSQLKAHDFYQRIRDLREVSAGHKAETARSLIAEFYESFAGLWLAGLELLELSYRYNLPSEEVAKLKNSLQTIQGNSKDEKRCLELGFELAAKAL